MVAAATHSLCDAANAMVQGHSSEEKLISAAKQVAASTAQLLVACKVKADVDSVAMRRLQAAGNAVKRATEALVRAAQQASGNMDNVDPLTVNERMVGGIAQVRSYSPAGKLAITQPSCVRLLFACVSDTLSINKCTAQTSKYILYNHIYAFN